MKIRHNCVGADHFMVAELALQGKVIHDGRAVMSLRRSKDHGSLRKYAERHIGANRTDAVADILKQLEWCCHLVDLSVQRVGLEFYQQEPIRNMLKVSLVAGYISRYLPNLNVLQPDGVQAFFSDPHMGELVKVNHMFMRVIAQFIELRLDAQAQSLPQ